METKKITISDNGRISVPENVQMRPFEIAELFGVYVSAVNATIKAVLKSGIIRPDTWHGATVSGNAILPEFYDLEMITALAFRINSPKADVFREWIMRKVTAGSNPLPATLFIQLPGNISLN